ncbi:MAG: glycosyltransferase [Afipia sp.]|nr:glycosyltransferase [Afipia sp.]
MIEYQKAIEHRMQPSSLMKPRQEVRTFWTGPNPSYYEELSLRSAVASGARVLLYTYNKNLTVPEGVELVDAREVLSGPLYQFHHKDGDLSLALHSDLFRYLAIQKFGGWYMDLDIVVMTSELPDDKIYLAYQEDGVANAAVMKFPAQSPIMTAAIDEAMRLLPAAGTVAPGADHGIVGPKLITRLSSEYAIDHLVRPKASAYEIHPNEVLMFFDPGQCEAVLGRLVSSDFVHLWNDLWRALRIPKNLGPPEGSFLDAMFRRYGVDIPQGARLSYEAVEGWFREFWVMKELKQKLSTQSVPYDALDHLARSIQINGWQPGQRPFSNVGISPREDHPLAIEPQTLRTFWHGETIGPYQLMCLKSFAASGHRVEVFSYNRSLIVPDWIRVEDAAKVLPRELVLRPLGEEGAFAIHANLFRYALLQQMGGWWIDPDVLLLKPDLPPGDVFFADADVFGRVPTGVLKFPAGHGLLTEALAEIESLSDSLEDWERSGSALLTSLVGRHKLSGKIRNRVPLGPVSWFDVPDLFEPNSAERLNRLCKDFCFLHLHDDVWRRAGIPHDLAPPEGSFLDGQVRKYGVGADFPAKISFRELNRWVAHMYQCLSQRQT